jgi:hypothetical protein
MDYIKIFGDIVAMLCLTAFGAWVVYCVFGFPNLLTPNASSDDSDDDDSEPVFGIWDDTTKRWLTKENGAPIWARYDPEREFDVPMSMRFHNARKTRSGLAIREVGPDGAPILPEVEPVPEPKV